MDASIIRIISKISQDQVQNLEWLLTNGLGGYSSTTLDGAPTRKYHGLLVAALPAPYGRTNMVNFLGDVYVEGETEYNLSNICKVIDDKQCKQSFLNEFRLENGLPIWTYHLGKTILEKRIFLINRQNTVHVQYKLITGGPGEIKIRPYFNFRPHENRVDLPNELDRYSMMAKEGYFEINHVDYPPLRMLCPGKFNFVYATTVIDDVFYEIEFRRGYHNIGKIVSLGYFTAPIEKDIAVSFVASTEDWDVISTFKADNALDIEKERRNTLISLANPEKDASVASLEKELVFAADQFIILPATRKKDLIFLQAAGEEGRSIIAGYPWFTDWGRDTMISLEGLTLCTGRLKEADNILKTFSHYIHNGLIPNMFPEGKNVGLYHTVDATLWFFHAIERYYHYSKDKEMLHLMVPKLIDIVNWHVTGTLFGIKMDQDGLITQGQDDYALTWMDAKVEDWVVTPRRGKPVEINALWYNALRILEEFMKELNITENIKQITEYADRCQESFNKRFWFAEGKYLYDIVDGLDGKDDPACRPNQIFSISLKHPVLKKNHWKDVIETVKRELLTPVGLRTLSPSHPDYKRNYEGDLLSRDAAYHQGTIWPWLIGHYIDAWLKTFPKEIEEAKKALKGLEGHLEDACVGTIGEIFDAEPPYISRGCFAQAWSVAEYLRSLRKVYE